MICGSNATTRRTTRKTRRMVKKWRGQSRGETGRSKGGRAVDERGRFLSFAHGIRQLTRSRQHCFQLVRHESSSELRKRKKKKKNIYTHTHTHHSFTHLHTHPHPQYIFLLIFVFHVLPHPHKRPYFGTLATEKHPAAGAAPPTYSWLLMSSCSI